VCADYILAPLPKRRDKIVNATFSLEAKTADEISANCGACPAPLRA
jgi:hypothetical protein